MHWAPLKDLPAHDAAMRSERWNVNNHRTPLVLAHTTIRSNSRIENAYARVLHHCLFGFLVDLGWRVLMWLKKRIRRRRSPDVINVCVCAESWILYWRRKEKEGRERVAGWLAGKQTDRQTNSIFNYINWLVDRLALTLNITQDRWRYWWGKVCVNNCPNRKPLAEGFRG